ncbi:MAG: hypothetical protein EOM91_23820 [Sphingobacteriia bacterium]|nr:hypothetical protein [Sphingobacteriia bacterium]NCC40384.1 hypothetical protein [Gammaproteobacteria bacterium]
MARFTPPGLDLGIYDAATAWSPGRWLIELDRRRLLFDMLDLGPDNAAWVLRRLDDLLAHISAPDTTALSVGANCWIVTPQQPLVRSIRASPAQIDGVDVLTICDPQDLGVRATLLAVDLTAPRAAVLKAFEAWFDAETGQGPKRGQPAGAIREDTLARWAVNRFPAFWDLTLWLRATQRAEPTDAEWRDLLAVDDDRRDHFPGEARRTLAGDFDAALRRHLIANK